jgi:hypothetical protein
MLPVLLPLQLTRPNLRLPTTDPMTATIPPLQMSPRLSTLARGEMPRPRMPRRPRLPLVVMLRAVLLRAVMLLAVLPRAVMLRLPLPMPLLQLSQMPSP